MTTNDIIIKATELNNSMTNVNKALKRVASVKCRLNHAPGKATFQADMAACLEEERLLKAVREYLSEPRKTVNDLTETDIANMGYDEVCKAIRSIQSKKTHTKWADDCEKDDSGMFIPGSGAAYKEACRIEEMLKTRRDELQPEGTQRITKAAIIEFVDNLRNEPDLDVETCLNRIESFLKGGES